MVDRQTVARALLTATMVTKGKSASDVTADMVDVWADLANGANMGREDFTAAFRAVIDRSTFFPAWAEVLAEHGRRMSARSALITDPVHVLENGERRIGSRAVCLASGTDFTEIQDEPARCLPQTEEGRKLLESIVEE